MAEMIVAVGLVALIGVAMATLSTAAFQSSDFVEQSGEAMQHARVAIARIQRAVAAAHTSEEFPGFLVVSRPVSTYQFYDTLVVWLPDGEPASPDGLPLASELVLFTYDESSPNRLVEITTPTLAVPTSSTGDTAAWLALTASMKTHPNAVVVQLSDLLHTANVSGTGGGLRGVLQFAPFHQPSEQEWQDYQLGNTAFTELPWVQGIHSSQSGLRQSRVAFDFQLQGDRTATATTATVIPFFGSAAVYYELNP